MKQALCGLITWTAVMGMAGGLGSAGLAIAQPQANPVYVDDSPTAADAFARVREHVAAGNLDEAVRVVQITLDQQPDRVVASEKDKELFVSVRGGVHEYLLKTPELLSRYRALITARAERQLADGLTEQVERSLLMTPAGFDAALVLAQRSIEDARFEAARLTLEQLEKHPDRTGERGANAARLAAMLARYIDRREVRERAERWAAEAKLGAVDVKPEQWPAAAKLVGVSPLTPLPVLNTAGMISKPLWTVSTNPTATPPDPSAPVQGVRAGAASIPPYARELLVVPTIEGDTVFVNDGTVVSAWDRFTLSSRWAVSPGVADAPAPESGVRGSRVRLERFGYGYGRNEDLGTVAVQGRTAVAATGRASNGGRDADDRLHALDTTTGRVRWTVQIGALDPAIADSGVRGPAAIVEGTVVVAARKYQPERRLVSLTLVGLDLKTGELRWVRPIGSAGSLPFVVQTLGAEAMTVGDGVIYRADRLGVIGAAEAATGRVRWVRRMAVDSGNTNDQISSWQVSKPVIDGSSVITLSPDGRKVIRLDALTGTILGERDASELGAPPARYLLRVGDLLAVVGEDRVGLVRASAFEIDRPKSTQPIPQPGIRGRVSVVGDRLLVPTVTGFSLFDPARPEAPVQAIALEDPGQVLALESQLVVADDQRLHSYLLWDVAESLLMQRIKADPKDPAPAVTFVELAYRAEHPERLAGAVETAMNALKRAEPGEATEASRARLMGAINAMTLAALEPGGVAISRGQTAPKPISDKALLEILVARLGELAREPDEKVAFVLASGRVQENKGAFDLAVGEYQRVLEDPAFAGSTWRGPQLAVRAELEATRRIEQLLKQHGAQVYAAQEVRAGTELAGFGPTPTAEQLEGLVARFPLSNQTPRTWARLAALDTEAGKTQAATGALESGLRAAQRIPDAPSDAVGELAGQLVVALRTRGQTAAAAGVLRTVRTRFPAVALTAGGKPIDADKVGAELADAIAAAMRWARVGAVKPENAQVIAGWSLMEPLLTDTVPTVSSLVALRSDEAVSVWGSPTTGSGERGETLVKMWSRDIAEGYESHLVKRTSDAAYFLFVSATDGFVEKVAGGGGAGAPAISKWKSESLAKAFMKDDSRGMRRLPGVMADTITTPGEGMQDPRNIVIAMDDRMIVLVQRSGRAAGIDADTGEVLWAERTPIGRVYDVQVSGGTLVIAGDQETVGPGNIVTELKPAIQVMDARTGRLTQKLVDGALGGPGGGAGGHVHWVRLTDAGTVIAGLDSAVVCLDTASAQVNWTITNADILPAAAAWVFGDELVLLSPDRTLWLASVSTGRMRPGALEVPRTHVDAARSIEVFPLSAVPGGGFAVATQQGLAVFNADGTLTGLDGMGGSTAMVPPHAAEGRAVTIETVAEGRTGDGLMMFSMHGLDTAGGALADSRPVLLGARPTAMTLLDGRVVVTAGSVTIVLEAPAAKK